MDSEGLAWLFICWGIFSDYITIVTLIMSLIHVFVFTSVTFLFFLLEAHFGGVLPAVVPGIKGILCGAGTVYGSAATVLNAKYKRWILPIGLSSKNSHQDEAISNLTLKEVGSASIS